MSSPLWCLKGVPPAQGEVTWYGAGWAQGSSSKAGGEVWGVLVHPGLDLPAAQSSLMLLLLCKSKMLQDWCRQRVWDESTLVYVLLTAPNPGLLLSQECWGCLRCVGHQEWSSQNMYLQPSEHWRASWLWNIEWPPSCREDRWKAFPRKDCGVCVAQELTKSC